MANPTLYLYAAEKLTLRDAEHAVTIWQIVTTHGVCATKGDDRFSFSALDAGCYGRDNVKGEPHLGQRGDQCPTLRYVHSRGSRPRWTANQMSPSAFARAAYLLQILEGNTWRRFQDLTQTHIPYQESTCS